MRKPQTSIIEMPIEWTDAELTEIMRLHIINGWTVGHAESVVFNKRSVTKDLSIADMLA